MNDRIFLPLLAAAALLGGCSTLDVPRADNYAATGQKKARAVHHWEVLADDVAGRILERTRDWIQGGIPVYVSPAGDTSFNQGFRKLLITRLMERGIAVSNQPTDLTLSFETQVVQHPAQVSNATQMPFTQLGAGISVARDFALYDRSAASFTASALTLGMITDIARMNTRGLAAGGPTRTEVLITTSLESADRYVVRTADIYYVEPEDSVLYEKRVEAPPAPAPLAPSKTWKVAP